MLMFLLGPAFTDEVIDIETRKISGLLEGECVARETCKHTSGEKLRDDHRKASVGNLRGLCVNAVWWASFIAKRGEAIMYGKHDMWNLCVAQIDATGHAPAEAAMRSRAATARW